MKSRSNQRELYDLLLTTPAIRRNFERIQRPQHRCSKSNAGRTACPEERLSAQTMDLVSGSSILSARLLLPSSKYPSSSMKSLVSPAGRIMDASRKGILGVRGPEPEREDPEDEAGPVRWADCAREISAYSHSELREGICAVRDNDEIMGVGWILGN